MRRRGLDDDRPLPNGLHLGPRSRRFDAQLSGTSNIDDDALVENDPAYDMVDTVRFRAEPTPSRKLITALLLEGLRLAMRPESRLPMRNARQWIATTDYADPMSFVSVCDQLGVEPDWIRRRMHEAVQRASTLPKLTLVPTRPSPGRPVAFVVMERVSAAG